MISFLSKVSQIQLDVSHGDINLFFFEWNVKIEVKIQVCSLISLGEFHLVFV